MSNSNSLYMKAQRVSGSKRKTKSYGENRVCDEDGCEQIMSKYNHNDKCFQHAPKRIPRIRGHEILDSRKKKKNGA